MLMENLKVINVMLVMSARKILVRLQVSFGIISRKNINLIAIYIAYSQTTV